MKASSAACSLRVRSERAKSIGSRAYSTAAVVSEEPTGADYGPELHRRGERVPEGGPGVRRGEAARRHPRPDPRGQEAAPRGLQALASTPPRAGMGRTHLAEGARGHRLGPGRAV